MTITKRKKGGYIARQYLLSRGGTDRERKFSLIAAIILMITILTPTYNRAYILPVLFQSLCRQTSKKFEWVVIDDGSSDHTKELVVSWQKEHTGFAINYVYKENTGKTKSVNYGMRYVQYDHTYILDSDDYLVDDAVETILTWLESIKDKPDFAGVSGMRANHKGEVLGGSISFEYIDAKNTERRKYGLLGDKAEVYRTEILRMYPFPEFENEKYVPESTSWNSIAYAGYKLRWFNKTICICEYLEDGITKNNDKFLHNFNGFTYNTKLAIKSNSFIYQISFMGGFVDAAQKKRMSFADMAKTLEVNQGMIYLAVLGNVLKPIIKKL